jgi:glycosyltransferase involved in cell wall biosynthesis
MRKSDAPSCPAGAVDDGTRIAVLIPCFNEEVTIKKVVNDFQEQLPAATIYVYDNNSSDNTASIAAAEGAVVVREKRQGKGFVVASMFEDIEADVFVMVDGDDTYPAESVHDLIRPIVEERADMTVGTRLIEYADHSFRPLHVFGNALVVKLVNVIFGSRLTDIMSGYRAFNRDFVKNVPIVSKGFEVETQMTLQALYYDFVIVETPICYGIRPEGSHSKLKTFSDGARVLLKIVDIFKAYRPLAFFLAVASFLFCLGLLIGSVPVVEFLETAKITHLPSAVLASGIMIIAVICVAIGTILDSINHRVRELMRVVSSTRSPRPVAARPADARPSQTAQAQADPPAARAIVDVEGVFGASWQSSPMEESL